MFIALVVAVSVTGCQTQADQEAAIEAALEQDKQEIAAKRRAGLITHEESIRQQYAAVRRYWPVLSDGREAFWRAAIYIATQRDKGQLSEAEYDYRLQEARTQYVVNEDRHYATVVATLNSRRPYVCNRVGTSAFCN